jgi:hypothetical protein
MFFFAGSRSAASGSVFRNSCSAPMSFIEPFSFWLMPLKVTDSVNDWRSFAICCGLSPASGPCASSARKYCFFAVSGSVSAKRSICSR